MTFAYSLREHLNMELSTSLNFSDPAGRPKQLAQAAATGALIQGLHTMMRRHYPILHGFDWRPMDEDNVCRRHTCTRCRRAHRDGGPTIEETTAHGCGCATGNSIALMGPLSRPRIEYVCGNAEVECIGLTALRQNIRMARPSGIVTAVYTVQTDQQLCFRTVTGSGA